MRQFLACLCLVAAAAPLHADEVDQNAILRLGNLVQYVGDGVRADAGVDAFVEAMAPPASDAEKWFVSVLTTRGCGACEVLKREWEKNPALLALANPKDAKQSWAHWGVYDLTDESQQFRFQNIKVSAFPTILVQPPRTGRFGDPATVVFQGKYGGDPDQLARDITDAIRQYVAQLPAVAQGTAAIGLDPPWSPTPQINPYQPAVQPAIQPSVLPFDPTIPPQTPTTPTAGSWVTLAWPVVAPAAVAGIAWLVYAFRRQRLAQGKEPFLDQATLDQVLALLKKVAETPPQSPKA